MDLGVAIFLSSCAFSVAAIVVALFWSEKHEADRKWQRELHEESRRYRKQELGLCAKKPYGDKPNLN